MLPGSANLRRLMSIKRCTYEVLPSFIILIYYYFLTELIKKFLLDVDWAETEYLIVDTPPGTTDEHFALQEYLNKTVELDGAVLVTTPHVCDL